MFLPAFPSIGRTARNRAQVGFEKWTDETGEPNHPISG